METVADARHAFSRRRFFTEIRLLALLAELLLLLLVFAVTSRHSRSEQAEKGCGKLYFDLNAARVPEIRCSCNAP